MYINVIELAESFGVSESVIETWITREGLPHTIDRGRVLFNRAEVTQWAASRGLVAKAGFLARATQDFQTECQLSALLRNGGVFRGIAGDSVAPVLDTVIGKLKGASPAVIKMLCQRLHSAGGIVWAPVGAGFALPHPSVRISLGRESGALALIFLSTPLLLGENESPPDGIPVTRLLFFIAPSPRAHLDLLGRISRLLSKADAKTGLRAEASDQELLSWVAANNASGAGGGQSAGTSQ